MKTNMFKKIIATVLALSAVTIPSLSLAATADPVTIADFTFLSNVTAGQFNTIEGLNNAFSSKTTAKIVDNGTAPLSVAVEQNNWLTTTSANGAAGDTTVMNVVFEEPVETGKVTMNWQVEGAQYNGRNLIVNETNVANLGNATVNYYLGEVAGFPFDTTASSVVSNSYGVFCTDAKNGYGAVALTVEAYRESTSDTWAVKGYAKNVLIFQGTLPAEDLRSFGVSHYLTAAGQTTKILKLTATHEAYVEPTFETSDETVLVNADFKQVTAGTYNSVSAFNEAANIQGASVTQTDGMTVAYNVGTSGANLTSSVTGKTLRFDLTFDEAIETGEVAFDYVLTNKLNATNIHLNGTNILNTAHHSTWGGAYVTSAGASFPFESGVDANLSCSMNGDSSIHIRAVASRENTTDEWAVKVYRTSDNKLITQGTIPANNITKFGVSRHWESTSYSISVTSLKATKAAVSPIGAVKVVNTGDTEALDDLSAGGNVTCVVDVEQPGGILYAALYSNGYKLLAVKSATVTEAGEVELPFTNVAADASQHMKLFYWTKKFQPIIGFMDPLNPMN